MGLEGSSQMDPILGHFNPSHPQNKIFVCIPNKPILFVIHRPGSPNWFPPPICFNQNYVCLCIFVVLAPFTARLIFLTESTRHLNSTVLRQSFGS